MRKPLRMIVLAIAAIVLFFALTEPAEAWTPVRRVWHPVTQDLAGALAEGSSPGATTRDWERCRWRWLSRLERTMPRHASHEIVVVCTDGLVEWM